MYVYFQTFSRVFCQESTLNSLRRGFWTACMRALLSCSSSAFSVCTKDTLTLQSFWKHRWFKWVETDPHFDMLTNSALGLMPTALRQLTDPFIYSHVKWIYYLFKYSSRKRRFPMFTRSCPSWSNPRWSNTCNPFGGHIQTKFTIYTLPVLSN